MPSKGKPARRTPGSAPLPTRLLREVGRLHARAQRQAIVCIGASTTQCTILTELGQASRMTQGELARRLRIDKGWISRAVDQLVDEGLVQKLNGETDRRVVYLSLTPAGRERHERIEAALDGHMVRVLTRVPEDERAGVARALEWLYHAYVSDLASATSAEVESA